ncbi:MAG TPA: FUSC family membrane protein, partial [Gillisia sp.]|nr:FUSC family membrane protein [Gillisia sp.]
MKEVFADRYMRFRAFLKSTDLSKAILLGFAITFPIFIGVLINKLDYGMAMALGALLCSSSDVSGSTRHKNIGIILSSILVVLVSLAGAYLNFSSWYYLPVLGLIMFSISYFAVFGFRASLIAFSGLFAMVLSFADPGEIELYERAFLMGAGGLLFLLFNLILQVLNPRRQTDQYLSETIELTGKYIETRANLISGDSDRNELQRQLIELQTELNLKHETLRDILISARKNSGNSAYQRKRLLIFIQLVDVLELAMANPVNYEKLDDLLQNDPDILFSFKALILSMSRRLEAFTRYIRHGHVLQEDHHMMEGLEKIQSQIENYGKGLSDSTGEGHIMLQNLLDYQETQLQKIRKIERLLIQKETGEIGVLKKDEMARFLTPQDYDPKILIENLSFNSAIFKHSLRLAVIVMIGYGIGEFFALQNAYWILLTIIVIMRPSYGLTKTRSKQRTAGTLIGAGIAMGIVFLTQNPVLYAVLGVISLVTAFSMVQKNYKTSAIFITLSVVFVYALLEP